MSKPLSKMNTTSNILQQPSNLAGNRNPVDVTNNTRKTTSGNSHTENELKVCNTHVCTQQRTQPSFAKLAIFINMIQHKLVYKSVIHPLEQIV